MGVLKYWSIGSTVATTLRNTNINTIQIFYMTFCKSSRINFVDNSYLNESLMKSILKKKEIEAQNKWYNKFPTAKAAKTVFICLCAAGLFL